MTQITGTLGALHMLVDSLERSGMESTATVTITQKAMNDADRTYAEALATSPKFDENTSIGFKVKRP